MQTPKKILMLLSNAFDPDPRVHREAVALVGQGYDVQILCWDRDLKAPEFETIDGIKIQRVFVKSTHGRGSTQMAFLGLFWIRAFLKALFIPFDVIHAHDFDTLPLGYSLAKLKDSKLVYDSHESYVDMLHDHPGLLRKSIFFIENLLIKQVDLLITVGEKLRSRFKKRGATHTCVVGNWQDPAKFKFTGKEILAEKNKLNIKKDQKVICFIANLGMERQVPQLIEAVSKTPEMYLIIGGNGPCRNIVEKAAQTYENIHYLGYVHPSKVPFYTACADIIFYGFDPENPNAKFSAPNKLFEGLAAGKIILTGNFGEIARIVKETQSGIILEDYSPQNIQKALQRILNKGSHQFCNNSLVASVRQYNLTNAGNILSGHYRRLIVR